MSPVNNINDDAIEEIVSDESNHRNAAFFETTSSLGDIHEINFDRNEDTEDNQVNVEEDETTVVPFVEPSDESTLESLSTPSMNSSFSTNDNSTQMNFRSILDVVDGVDPIKVVEVVKSLKHGSLIETVNPNEHVRTVGLYNCYLGFCFKLRLAFSFRFRKYLILIIDFYYYFIILAIPEHIISRSDNGITQPSTSVDNDIELRSERENDLHIQFLTVQRN